MAEHGTVAIHAIQPVDIAVKGSKAFAQSIGTISTRIQKDDTAYDLVAHCRLRVLPAVLVNRSCFVNQGLYTTPVCSSQHFIVF